MKKAIIAIAALLALIILGCGDVVDVSPEEWARNTARIEAGSEALREYVDLMRDLETGAKRISELNADIFVDDEFDADEFTKTNETIVSGAKAQAEALRELAAAMREVNEAARESDELQTSYPRAGGGDIQAATEEQRECYYALLYRSLNYGAGHVEVARLVLQLDPATMTVLERRVMDEILSSMDSDIVAACDDYIYGGP